MIDEVCAAPNRQFGVDAILERRETQILEPSGLGLDRGLEGDVRERFAAPEPERLAELVRGGASVAALERAAGLTSQPLLMSGRAGQIVAGVVTAAVLAATSQAAAPDRVTEPTWKRALWVRSDALNQRYGLGEYSQETASTAEPSWRRALRIRGEAMNRT